MKLFLTLLIGLYLSVASSDVRACSIGLGFDTRVETWSSRSGDSPRTPDIKLHKLMRGDYSADARPCGHIAYLELRLAGDIDDDIVGFHIRTVDAKSVPFFIPAHLIYPRQVDETAWAFWFAWPDLLPDNGELPPVLWRLEITQVSETGAVSSPRNILVEHRGG